MISKTMLLNSSVQDNHKQSSSKRQVTWKPKQGQTILLQHYFGRDAFPSDAEKAAIVKDINIRFNSNVTIDQVSSWFEARRPLAAADNLGRKYTPQKVKEFSEEEQKYLLDKFRNRKHPSLSQIAEAAKTLRVKPFQIENWYKETKSLMKDSKLISESHDHSHQEGEVSHIEKSKMSQSGSMIRTSEKDVCFECEDEVKEWFTKNKKKLKVEDCQIKREEVRLPTTQNITEINQKRLDENGANRLSLGMKLDCSLLSSVRGSLSNDNQVMNQSHQGSATIKPITLINTAQKEHAKNSLLGANNSSLGCGPFNMRGGLIDQSGTFMQHNPYIKTYNNNQIMRSQPINPMMGSQPIGHSFTNNVKIVSSDSNRDLNITTINNYYMMNAPRPSDIVIYNQSLSPSPIMINPFQGYPTPITNPYNYIQTQGNVPVQVIIINAQNKPLNPSSNSKV